MIFIELLIIIIILLVVVNFAIAYIIVHPFRQKIVKSPKDYKMDYENVEFKSVDGKNIKGWLLKSHKSSATSRKLIILTHAMPFNRHGFCVKNQGPIKLFKVDVDLLKTAKVLNKAGYSVLMFDFRNHGESDSGITGVGLNEWQDVVGAVDFLTNSYQLKANSLAFCSFCMGANSTIIAFSKAAKKLAGIKCAVFIQPISMLVFLQTFMRNQFSPIFLPFLHLIEFFARLMGGHEFKSMTLISYAKDVKIPVLHIQGKYDNWTQESDTIAIYNNFSGPKKLWLIDKKMNRFEAYNYVGNHPEKILEFYKRYF